MILAGYGIASRSSSTTKIIQSYVSKTYSDKGNPLNVNIFTLRVSIKHDDSSDNNIIPVNKKISNNQKPNWFTNGVQFNKEDTPILLQEDGGKIIETIEQLAECVTFVYKSARSFG
jgi:hypothetical protein